MTASWFSTIRTDVVGDVPTDEIERVAAHRVLGGFELEVDAERFRESIGVGQEPGREVMGLMWPDKPRIDRFQSPEVERHESADQTGVVGGSLANSLKTVQPLKRSSISSSSSTPSTVAQLRSC